MEERLGSVADSVTEEMRKQGGPGGEGCTPPGSTVLALAESPERRGRGCWDAGRMNQDPAGRPPSS